MYQHILMPLENTETDHAIIAHIKQLALLMNSKITLLHVADGFAARYQEQLNLVPSEEMIKDQHYLERVQKELQQAGLMVDIYLDTGEPVKKILEYADKNNCDLIAMSTHGHGMFKDFLFGSVAADVRHQTNLPVLLLKGR
ncbi:MAG: universal stress protein [Oligoflexia bacterium]|nr:universal stress protein [Oligoflexia bacterium]